MPRQSSVLLVSTEHTFYIITIYSRDYENHREGFRNSKGGILDVKVLFAGLDYYGYTTKIIREFERLGATVDFVDIQPGSLGMKIWRTVMPASYQRAAHLRNARTIERTVATRYDRVVFLQAHQIAFETLARLRELQPQARFVLYNWDALTTHDYLPQAPLFDEVHTFDPVDARAHGFYYLPLFCSREMQGLARNRAPTRSVYTVGNIVNPRRYDAIKAFETYCNQHDIAFEAFMKISLVVYMRFLRAGRIPRGVSLRSIKPEAFRAMIERSAATFDFANHQAQAGHTMRTFENLCGGKKIITNNRSVRDEAFFSDDQFLVYEALDFTGVAEFLDRPLADIQAEFPQYRIQAFARALLGCNAADQHT